MQMFCSIITLNYSLYATRKPNLKWHTITNTTPDSQPSTTVLAPLGVSSRLTRLRQTRIRQTYDERAKKSRQALADIFALHYWRDTRWWLSPKRASAASSMPARPSLLSTASTAHRPDHQSRLRPLWPRLLRAQSRSIQDSKWSRPTASHWFHHRLPLIWARLNILCSLP